MVLVMVRGKELGRLAQLSCSVMHAAATVVVVVGAAVMAVVVAAIFLVAWVPQ